MNFDDAFDRLLEHEGGYSNHAADPGGKTMYGITEAVARAHGYVGDMQELSADFAKKIYKSNYWDTVRADELPDHIRYTTFDAAVNSGPTQSIKWLQQAVGVPADGIIGPVTLKAVRAAQAESLRAAMLGCRLMFLTNLPGWGSFGRGWSRRIAKELMT